MNSLDILGSLIKGSMGASAGRLDRTFGNQGSSAPAGGVAGMPGTGSGALFDILGKVAGSMLGGGASAPAPGASAGAGFSTADIITTLGKAVLGGSSNSSIGSAGAGVNSVIGVLAAQALAMAKRMMAGGQTTGALQAIDTNGANAVLAGLRKPVNADEERQVLDVATLTVRAMINAAKSDGRIDEKESERLVGKLREDGITDEEQRFVMAEMRKPMDTDAIVRAVPNEQVAAQLYTASLMAINVDTDVERRYMQELAAKLGLNQQVVTFLHQAVGVA